MNMFGIKNIKKKNIYGRDKIFHYFCIEVQEKSLLYILIFRCLIL